MIVPALPFFLLLAAIALLPLLYKHWWEKYYPALSFGLAAVTAGYYLLTQESIAPVVHSLHEYFSFIALIGALYVIAGGIHIRLRGRSTPLNNVLFLTAGAILSNLLGTTGASMVLIRPYLRANRYRIRPYHVVFFIFIVSNVGGALTPIGDPPLFLGYLKGIPFFWTLEHLWPVWAFALTCLLGIFFVVDHREFRGLPAAQRHRIDDTGETAEISGWHNMFFLFIVLGAVVLPDAYFFREAVMITAAAASYRFTDRSIHQKNDFSFGPVKEVGILFLGIFVTMVPALEWIKISSPSLGFDHAGQFYWASGTLSSVLDNAPTYLNFFNVSVGSFVPDRTIDTVRHVLQTPGYLTVTGLPADITSTIAVIARYFPDPVTARALTDDQLATMYLIGAKSIIIQAISIGAVFFGANTYIGNGPNLMVKGIAEQSDAPCPSFGAYIYRYTIPVMLPVLVLVWLVFFR